MNKKLHRVLDEIQKTEEKIAAWQEHLGELNIQKEMLEDAEIIKSVRSMRLNSRELLSVLEGIQNGTVVLSEEPEMAEDSGSAEIIKPENRPWKLYLRFFTPEENSAAADTKCPEASTA